MRKLINLLIFIFISMPAWAAYPNYSVCPSGCDFNTLQGAVNDVSTNHSTPASPVTITISGSWSSADTTAVNFTGITTTSSNTITVTATGTAKSNGALPTGGGAYWIKAAASDGISISTNFVTIDGVAIDASTSGDNAITINNYTTSTTVRNTFMKVSGQNAINVANGNGRGTNYFYNNVCQGDGAHPYTVCAGSEGGGDSSTSFYIYNNTAYGMGQAYDLNNGGLSPNIYFSNNVASSSYTASINHPYSATSGSNNICDDASSCTTSPLTNGTNSATSYTSYFTSPATGDFSVKSGSILIGAGVNLFSTFTTDITGATRQSSGAWDDGAFKYGSTPPPPVTQSFTQINRVGVNNAQIN